MYSVYGTAKDTRCLGHDIVNPPIVNTAALRNGEKTAVLENGSKGSQIDITKKNIIFGT